MSEASLRNAQRLDLCRLDTLCAKLNASRATAREALTNGQNSKVGNSAHDITMLCADITKIAGRMHEAAEAIRVAENEKAQRLAEIEHGPLISTLREIIEIGHRPALRLVGADHHNSKQGA